MGEIKSRLDGDSLEDAFRKVASAKELRRYDVTDLMPHPTTGEPIPLKRNYLSPHRDSVVRLDEGPEQKERAQIFGFVLAGESRLSRETLVGMFSELSAGLDASVVPNLLVTLDGHAVRWGQVAKGERKEVRKSAAGTYGVTVHKDGPEAWQDSWSAETATHAGGSRPPDPFRMLVRWIKQGAELGRTSDVRSFDRYFEEKRAEQRNPSSQFQECRRPDKRRTALTVRVWRTEFTDQRAAVLRCAAFLRGKRDVPELAKTIQVHRTPVVKDGHCGVRPLQIRVHAHVAKTWNESTRGLPSHRRTCAAPVATARPVGPGLSRCPAPAKGCRHVPNNMGPCPISIQVFFPDAPRSCDGMESRFVQAEARVRMPLLRSPRPRSVPARRRGSSARRP